MGWPTKTNCDTTLRPTLGNPASLVPVVYRPAPMSAQALAIYCHPPAPDPRPISPPASVSPRLAGEGLGVRADSATPPPVPDAAAVAPPIMDAAQHPKTTAIIILIDPDDPAYDEPWSSAPPYPPT